MPSSSDDTFTMKQCTSSELIADVRISILSQAVFCVTPTLRRWVRFDSTHFSKRHVEACTAGARPDTVLFNPLGTSSNFMCN
jgi:hypothetical protein